MDYVQALNLDELETTYVNVALSESMVDARRIRWLTRNVKNHLLKNMRACVDAWYSGTSTTVNWLGATVDLCVVPRDFHGTRELGYTKVRLDVFQLTPEQRAAHDSGAATFRFNSLAEHGEQLRHLCDALEANVKKPTWDSVTPMAAKEIAESWMARLAKEKLESSGLVEMVDEFDNGMHLVKLLDEEAYKAEGSLMHHCVGSYWGRHAAIYSLRRDKDRLATIEISIDGYVTQVRCACNAAPDAELKRFLETEVYPKYNWSTDRPRVNTGFFANLAGHLNGGFRLGAMNIDDRLTIRGPRGDVGYPYPELTQATFMAAGRYALPLDVVDVETSVGTHRFYPTTGQIDVSVTGMYADCTLSVRGHFQRGVDPTNMHIVRNGVTARITNVMQHQNYGEGESQMTIGFNLEAARLPDFFGR